MHIYFFQHIFTNGRNGKFLKTTNLYSNSLSLSLSFKVLQPNMHIDFKGAALSSVDPKYEFRLVMAMAMA